MQFLFIVALFLLISPMIIGVIIQLTSFNVLGYMEYIALLYQAMESGISILTYFIEPWLIRNSLGVFIALESIYYTYRILMFVLGKIPMLAISDK